VKTLLIRLLILGTVVTAPPALEPITARNVDQLTELTTMQDAENSAAVVRLAFSPDGTLLASEQAPASIRLWDVETGKLRLVMQYDGGDVAVLWDWERGQSSTITGCRPLAFSPDGSTLVCSGSNTDSLELWDVQDSFNPAHLKRLSINGWPVVFTPDGDQIILPVWTLSGNVWVSEDQMLHVWDIETDTSQDTFQRIDVSTINAMMFSTSGRFLAYTGYDRGGEGSVIVVWDLTTGAFWLWSLDGGLYPWGTVIAFSSDESLLIFGMRRGMIRVVDTLTWDEIVSFASGDESISAVAVSADGTRLATGSTNGVIRLWGVPE
jgi:WD40 repeat protein